MHIYVQQQIKKADLDAKEKMNPAFNTFLNIFLNYHRFNNMNEEAKAALRQEKWKEFLEQEQSNPKKEVTGILSMFKSGDSGAKISKIKFDMKYRVKEQMEMMSMTSMLRAKIFNIQPDEDMKEDQIENVKDAL